MPEATAPRRAALFTDGSAGNEKQAAALAHYLGLEPQVHRVRLRGLSGLLAPFLLPGRLADLDCTPSLDLARVAPVLIGCGRAGGVALSVLKRQNPAFTTLQILDPRCPPTRFDLVITPQHDRLRGNNVLISLGALNQVDGAFLKRARADFAELCTLRSPRVAVLFGAPTRHAQIDQAYVDRLFAALPAEGTLFITASRRTPPAMVERLRALAHGRGRIWASAEDGPNPYPGFLAAAERIVVTPDSVNMLSEACGTDVPVEILLPLRLSGKLQKFVDALLQSGRVRLLGDREPASAIVPFRETAAIAAEVRRRLGWPAG